ncbi:MAG: hypothetical protein ACPGVK_04120 [Halocynthiibacter sp.]
MTSTVSIFDLIRFVRVHIRPLLTSGLCGLTLGMVAIVMLPKSYTATTILTVAPDTRLSFEQDYLKSPTDKDISSYAQSKVAFLNSDAFHLTVLMQENLLLMADYAPKGGRNQPSLGKGNHSQTDIRHAQKMLRKNLSVKLQGQTNIVTIAARASSAKGAAALANGTVRTFLNEERGRNVAQLTKRKSALKSQIEKARITLNTAQTAHVVEILHFAKNQFPLLTDPTLKSAIITALTPINDRSGSLEHRLEAGLLPSDQHVERAALNPKTIPQINTITAAFPIEDLPNLHMLNIYQKQQSAKIATDTIQTALLQLENVEKLLSISIGKSEIIAKAIPPLRHSSPKQSLLIVLPTVFSVFLGAAFLWFKEENNLRISRPQDAPRHTNSHRSEEQTVPSKNTEKVLETSNL